MTHVEKAEYRPLTLSRGMGRPRTRLSAEIAEEITSRIVSGELAPRRSLPSENALADSFGVSRPVVREAVKLVEQKGLIRIRQGEGTTVRPREEWNLLDSDVLRLSLENGDGAARALRDDVIELRRHLELDMLTRAKGKITKDDLDEMEHHLAVMESATDPEELHRADSDFHGVIYRASGNEIARTVVFLLIAETRPLEGVGSAGRDLYVAANKVHRDILDRLKANDFDGAARALSDQITHQWLDRSASAGDTRPGH